MPGYVIHLAVGKVYSRKNEIEDLEAFENGLIVPDFTKNKSETHYGPNSCNPDLNKFLQSKGISNSFDEGYFLHLLTDYLFYNKFLKNWSPEIYNDYDILNSSIIQKYGIIIPKQIQDVVQYRGGKLSILDEEGIFKFINSVGNINVRKCISKNQFIMKDNEKGIEF